MELKRIKLAEIKPYKKNARKNDEAVEYVVKSIEQCEYVAPIILDENNVILAGHTRYKALKKLGYDEAECVIKEGLSEEQKKKYRLLDNKTAEFAEWDFDLLKDELEDLDFEDLDIDWGIDELPENNPYNIPDSEKGSLNDKFIVPPFSILDTRQGYWVNRKQIWREKIQDNAEARQNATVYGDQSFFESFNPVSLLDPVLCEIVAGWFMPQNTTDINCFDTFAGDTVFGFVSGYLGKNFTGIELRKEQADFNNMRVGEFGLTSKYICDDGRNVLNHIAKESQDLYFSCPPYYDLEQYSTLENDVSNQKSYKDFYIMVDDAFSKAIECLKNNRFAVIVAGDIRNKKDGAYYDFLGDIKHTFMRNGMKLYNEMILINPYGTASIRANRTMANRKVCKVHQNVLVFYKGDTSKIKDIFGEIDFTEALKEYESEDE